MDILAAIEHQEQLATGYGKLNQERADALDQYLGRPYGDEQEGRSQVVMRDVHDTIEWLKPSLMKVFTSGDEVCEFRPEGPEDEPQAKQETEYVNFVLTQKNQGFLILHDWFHDALVQKTGYVVVQYETEDISQRETYRGLTDDEFALLTRNKEVEIVEHEEGLDEMGQKYHSCVIKAIKQYGCVRIRNIPPERVLIAVDWPDLDLQQCPFVEIIEYKTVSELRSEGYEVEDNISDDSTQTDDGWLETRRSVTYDGGLEHEDIEADAATRRLRTRKVWIRFDADGDGIAELHRMVVVGRTILEDEEDDLIPVAALTPQRMPHEHYGMSAADMVADLQRIRTTLVRGYLDNMYLANNGRSAIDENRVNISDLLVSRPGGIVRINGDPSTAIVPLQHVQQGPAILQAIEYVDSVRENRTGVTRYNQGLDADSLNKTATGVNQIMQAAQQRIEMIARMFAETGVRSLMVIIHAVSLKHTRQVEMMKLRNQWVPVDPRTWKTRRDMTVSVGLGTGNKDQMLAHLQMIWQMQMAGMPMGIANPQNLYETAAKITQNAGFKHSEPYWQNPAQSPPMPPQPSPEQIKAEAESQKQQFLAQQDQMKFQAQQQLEREKLTMQQQVDQQREEMQARQKMLEAQQSAELERMRAETQAMQETRRLEFEKWKAELDATVKLQIAQMGKPEPDGRVDQMMQALQEIMEVVNDLSAPAQIIRDQSGRAVGVQRGKRTQSVVRDDQGRAMGLQ